jgi:hypothetical protein
MGARHGKEETRERERERSRERARRWRGRAGRSELEECGTCRGDEEESCGEEDAGKRKNKAQEADASGSPQIRIGQKQKNRRGWWKDEDGLGCFLDFPTFLFILEIKLQIF